MTLSSSKTIMWFRQDLRLQDNPALEYALQRGEILPVYIFDTSVPKDEIIGGASRWWLHNSLSSLSKNLQKYGHKLFIFKGDAQIVLTQLIESNHADAVTWNLCYEPYVIERDRQLKETLLSLGIHIQRFNGNLLFEPWAIKNQQDSPFKVFTPFWKHCLKLNPGNKVDSIKILTSGVLKNHPIQGLHIEDLNLLPKHPDWSGGLKETWVPGEAEALRRLKIFLDERVDDYHTQRNFMDQNGTSHLSPYLHFGEISPRYIWQECKKRLAINDSNGIHTFLSELGWREFSYYLMYHIPNLIKDPIQSRFNGFPWNKNKNYLKKWQKGETGIPIIDAAMRELWHTGYMHNRARMLVASFLTKNLLIPWQEGAEWFWNTLVDADLASNSASWQWVAGCGVDAAPYFRIFNPVTQSKTFDPKGDYIKKWVPELSSLPDQYIHEPWEAPLAILQTHNIRYPKPIVDLKQSREEALSAYKAIT